jgi:phosphohistidine swiveling domain-containing protein
MMIDFVLPFDRIRESYGDQVGGKGHALARLSQAGFPVPPGFVIASDAYHVFVAANSLNVLIADALADDEPAASSLRIETAFESADMPRPVAAAIHNAYLVLGEGNVAVRSSALAEDSKVASFAGQYETLLDIAGDDALLTAVRRCWASLWSERVITYRRHLGFEGSAAAMAVVVQRMVSAAQAGVAFTLDPISGRRDVIVIEAVAGRGESLVSGQATPRSYTIHRRDEHPKIEEGLLEEDQLTTIVRLAQEVESWAGQPQDIEWALDDAGCIHLLQARPITVAGTAASHEIVRWTRDNVGEVIPDPVTPLSWSVLNHLSNDAFVGVMRRLGIDSHSDKGLFDRFYGRVYFNQTLFQSTLGYFYPSRANWRVAPRMTLVALQALLLWHRLPAESRKVIGAVVEQHRSEEGLDLAAIPPAGVLSRLADWRGLGAAVMEVHMAVTVMGDLFYQALGKLLDRWGDGATTAVSLTTGLTGVRSAEAGRALAALAQRVRQDERLRALVLAAAPEALPARLADTEAGRLLWAQLETFLAEHGHSAAQEFELAAPRWRDEPMIVLSMLQAQVRVAADESATDPTATRLAAIARIEDRLVLPQRWLFGYLLRWAQTLTATRENLKYYLVMAHSRLRDLYLVLADWLVAAGRLHRPEDVFFLTADEVAALAKGEETPEEWHDESKRVSERRRAWEADQRVVPPLALDQQAGGRLCPASPFAAASHDDGHLLRGFAASPGSYTGRARVLSTPANGADIDPGEVLVTQAVSPGWAPLLLAAGALVTEIGGTLSHGAIIAREYGLPAVLDVAHATDRICTGQLVYVDGSQGVIYLLESHPPEDDCRRAG